MGRPKWKGVSSPPTQPGGAYNSQGTGSGAERGRYLRTLAKGPGSGIPAPPFLLLLLQEGEALGGRGRKGKLLEAQLQPPSLSARPWSNPSPPTRGGGQVVPGQLRQTRRAQPMGQGYSKCGLGPPDPHSYPRN